MPDARYQGMYAEHYVRTLALASGVNVAVWDVDDHGVDLILKAGGKKETPKIDVQVKSWSTPHGSEEFWHYDRLNEVQYNQLIGEKDQPPRYLVVLLVPEDEALFTDVVGDGLLLRHHAYYTTIEGPRIATPSRGKRPQVKVPKRNVLTPASLRGLVQPALVAQWSAS